MTYVCTTAIQSPFFSLSLSSLMRCSFVFHSRIDHQRAQAEFAWACSISLFNSSSCFLRLSLSLFSLSLFPLLVHPSHDLEYRRASRWSNIFLLSPADLTIHPHNRQGSAIVCSIAHTEEPLERPCAIDTSFFSKNRRKQQATSPLPPQVIIQH